MYGVSVFHVDIYLNLDCLLQSVYEAHTQQYRQTKNYAKTLNYFIKLNYFVK